jgi:hypothetical protein
MTGVTPCTDVRTLLPPRIGTLYTLARGSRRPAGKSDGGRKPIDSGASGGDQSARGELAAAIGEGGGGGTTPVRADRRLSGDLGVLVVKRCSR